MACICWQTNADALGSAHALPATGLANVDFHPNRMVQKSKIPHCAIANADLNGTRLTPTPRFVGANMTSCERQQRRCNTSRSRPLNKVS